MSYYGKNIGHGKRGESLVKAWFISQGMCVEDASLHDDKYHDIDCWATFDDTWHGIDITPGQYAVSIKRNDEGAKYGNICFELLQQERAIEYDTRTDTERWTKTGWWYTGKAPIYAMLQYSRLRIYSKVDVLNYLRSNGWLRTRGLTKARKDALMAVKGYRYDDAICGYLETGSVRHYLIDLNNENQDKTLIG